MSYSGIFSGNFKSRNRDHFASIVRVALSDNIITNKEQKFIDRLSILLEIEPSEVDKIIKNPESYPINPPSNEQRRLERLYDLSRIVVADDIADKDELKLLKKFTHALGFLPGKVESITKESIKLVQANVDEDEFILSLKKII
ncbi:MAG: fructose 1,6-bisphosphatase [Flavobacteriaceae bacterium]|nr:fructose 1,6-bisphosphatase [Flavobacteriaceae bacterium]|tara:strand:+ start:6643 stop:7071 length:429 start_codon:yes stop_codon:yes gene_type:complete